MASKDSVARINIAVSGDSTGFERSADKVIRKVKQVEKAAENLGDPIRDIFTDLSGAIPILGRLEEVFRSVSDALHRMRDHMSAFQQATQVAARAAGVPASGGPGSVAAAAAAGALASRRAEQAVEQAIRRSGSKPPPLPGSGGRILLEDLSTDDAIRRMGVLRGVPFGLMGTGRADAMGAQELAAALGTSGAAARMAAPSFGSVAAGVAGVAAAATVAVTALEGWRRWTIDNTQEILDNARAARVLGIAYKDFVALGELAEDVGVEITTVNRGLMRFAANLGRAKFGRFRAFEDLGLDVRGMSTPEALRATLDALAGIEDRATRAGLQMDIFGRSGVELMSLFDGGAAALEDAADEAERLGLALGPKALADVERLHAAVRAIDDTVEGTTNRLAGGGAGIAAGLTAAINDVLAASATPVGSQAITGAAAFGLPKLSLLASLADLYGRIRIPDEAAEASTGAAAQAEQLARAQEISEGLATPMDRYLDTVEELDALLDAGALSQEHYNAALARAQEALVKADAGLSRVKALLDASATPADKYAEAQADLDRALRMGAITLEQYNTALDHAREQYEQANPALREMQALLERSLSPLERYQQQWRKLSDLWQEGAISGADAAKAAQLLHEEFRKAEGIAAFEEAQRTPVERLREQANKIRGWAAMGLIDPTSAQRGMASAFKEFQDAVGATAVIDSVKTPTERAQDRLRDLHDMLRVGAISWETYSRAVRQVAEDYRDVTEEVRQSADQQREIADRADRERFGTGSLRTTVFPGLGGVPHFVPPHINVPHINIPHRGGQADVQYLQQIAATLQQMAHRQAATPMIGIV